MNQFSLNNLGGLGTKGGNTTFSITSPTQISGLDFWYKADSGVYTDAGTTLATDGQSVQQWNDLSGNNRHLSQATATARPIFQTNEQNGLPGVEFDLISATNRFMASTVTASATRTIFVACRNKTTTADNGRLFAFTSTASVFAGAGGYEYYANEALAPVVIGGTLTAATIITLSLTNSPSSLLSLYRNGTLGAAAFDPNDTITTETNFVLGSSLFFGADYGDCFIYEAFGYTSTLTPTQRNAVHTYLGTRWGITMA